jgi:hypothetical protein
VIGVPSTLDQPPVRNGNLWEIPGQAISQVR